MKRIWIARVATWRSGYKPGDAVSRFARDDSEYLFDAKIEYGAKDQIGRTIALKIDNPVVARLLGEQLIGWADLKEATKVVSAIIVEMRWNNHTNDSGDWCPWSHCGVRKNATTCEARCRNARAEEY